MEHPILKHMNTGMSRYSVEKGPHAKHGDAPHRNSSPANNITYGDKSGPTGYIGEQKADLMKYNAVDDKAGMSRMVSPLNSEGGIDKHGHIMNTGGDGKISKAERWARHQKGAPHHGGKPGGDQ